MRDYQSFVLYLTISPNINPLTSVRRMQRYDLQFADNAARRSKDRVARNAIL